MRKSVYFGLSEYEDNITNPNFFKKLEDGTVVSHTSLLTSRRVIEFAEVQNVVAQHVEHDSDIEREFGENCVFIVDNKALKDLQKSKEPIMFDVNNLVGV